MTSRTLSMLAVATLGITGLAWAQTAGQDQNTGAAPDKSMSTGAGQTGQNQTGMQPANTPASADQKITDKDFVQKAVSAGLYEVDAAKLVQDKVSDPQIKQLAKTMESDHKQTNTELTKIAKQSNIDVPSKPQGADQQMLVQLRQSNDQQLGQQYLQQQIQAHQQAIQLFQQGQQLQNPELKGFAERTLPKLQEHLQHLQQMSSSAQPAGAAMPGMDMPSTPDKNKPAPDNTPNPATPNPTTPNPATPNP